MHGWMEMLVRPSPPKCVATLVWYGVENPSPLYFLNQMIVKWTLIFLVHLTSQYSYYIQYIAHNEVVLDRARATLPITRTVIRTTQIVLRGFEMFVCEVYTRPASDMQSWKFFWGKRPWVIS